MKTLILYFSYTGNTRKKAKEFQKLTGADIEEIKTVQPYDGDYDDIVAQAQQDVQTNFKPEILPIRADIKKYDKIIIGTPVWWYTFAPAVAAALSEMDLEGKTVYPFATNAGWLGHTFKDFAAACKSANLKNGLNIKFSENTQITSQEEINEWIKSISEEE